MPKLKSNRGAAKRFRRTANGFKSARANRRHILTKKSTKRKRHLRAGLQVPKCEHDRLDQMLPA